MNFSEKYFGKVEIVAILECHINQVIEIHIAAFPGFFLSELGNDVLRVFYKSLLQDKTTIFYGVKNEGELVGFFVASLKSKGLYTRLFFKNISRFILPLFFSFSKNLSLLKRMMTSASSSSKLEVSTIYPASLLSICVSPAHAGKGIGKILLSTLEKELQLRKRHGYYLTTDANNNSDTNQFYLNFGFKLNGSYSQGKRIMNIYVKDIK
jgi:ribosomal protein S18 acetylase RimI-like enzyme